MFPAINVARVGLRATPRAARVQVSANQMVARRWLNDNAGNRTDDKAKLAFRFGLKDIPVELYPMLVCVVAACVGGGYALARQLYKDGSDLRMLPNSFRKTASSSSH
ncbi:hypothetical protein HD553DRAFT_319877 [Filobasidium floriforme]|uniref:uncharacterized protein n=1 Tax=Filobasidium floriforme TaxID=5210 RepID=UPI001E8D515D|nr:uncharacterized protein HD553DRAFT_319877 [Filobasidium floriforme]KAH8078335.1 hypothetical protein HD553DRAFT_319877 [Filobasidium floriforme]